jgi:transcription antitermination factor NusG
MLDTSISIQAVQNYSEQPREVIDGDSAIPWYVVRTQYHKEDRAEMGLMAAGLATFLPRIRARRRSRSHLPETLPLFPQYVFVKFDAAKSLRLVMYMLGVSYVVSCGGFPAQVAPEVIGLLHSRMEADGCIRIGPTLNSGDHVRIKSGPFAAMLGVVERDLPTKDRIMVLLATVATEVRVELPRDIVERCA